MIIDVMEDTFETEILNSKLPVLLDFWAPWCHPCRTIVPFLEEIDAEYEGRLKVCSINVDENRTITNQCHIMSVPTLQIYKNSVLLDQICGVSSDFKGNLKMKINKFLEG